jgi:hypothetical protein
VDANGDAAAAAWPDCRLCAAHIRRDPEDKGMVCAAINLINHVVMTATRAVAVERQEKIL